MWIVGKRFSRICSSRPVTSSDAWAHPPHSVAPSAIAREQARMRRLPDVVIGVSGEAKPRTLTAKCDSRVLPGAGGRVGHREMHGRQAILGPLPHQDVGGLEGEAVAPGVEQRAGLSPGRESLAERLEAP